MPNKRHAPHAPASSSDNLTQSTSPLKKQATHSEQPQRNIFDTFALSEELITQPKSPLSISSSSSSGSSDEAVDPNTPTDPLSSLFFIAPPRRLSRRQEIDINNPMVKHAISSEYYPDYARNADACNAFNSWHAEKLDLFNCSDYTLKKLASLDFLRNKVSSRRVIPVSLYMTKDILNIDKITGLLVFDFDQTLSDKHTLGSDFDENELDLTGYHMDDSQREANLRHASTIRTALINAKAKNIRMAVITRHHDITHVLAYLQTLVAGIADNATIDDYFSMVLCSPTPMGHTLGMDERTEGMKDGELVFVGKLLGINKLLSPIPLLMVDDETSNQPTERVSIGLNGQVDIGFAHAMPDTADCTTSSSSSTVTPPTYLEVITTFISKITEITPVLSPTP